ncbi:hypothetical protein GGI07_004709 [Coemansia sp. Benny D115]|nr:hypothetical protein GGI07_004709 [Coemansia sp. Benny D115]
MTDARFAADGTEQQQQMVAVPADMEEWANMDFLSEGVFGSADGRNRSISNSTAWRSTPPRPMTSASSSDLSSATFPLPLSQTPINDPIQRIALCTESTDPNEVEDGLDELANLLKVALQPAAESLPDRTLYALSHHVPRLLAHFKWYIRARAYKLLRRLPSPRALEYCREYIELCVMHTISLEDQAHEEREQGVKFVRWTMRFDPALWVLSPQVVKALMAVAEQADDRMRGICLETLCECLVLAPERLWYVNGIRTLTQAALDGPWAISVTIASALAHMFDKAETRRYVHVGVALGGIVSALTESAGKDHALMERAKIAAFMLTQLLKSWGGLQYFLSEGRRAIDALVKALALTHANAKIILGMLLELFGLSDDFDAVQFEQQPRFDVELLSPFNLPTNAITQTAARSRLLPVDYIRTLLLTVFIEAGLVDALISVALASPQAEVVDASATLLKWLAQHPHIPLPEAHVAGFQTLGALVTAALGEDDEDSPSALAARRVVSKIEAIPSLSMGQLPSQQTDAWAASLASSVFYRQHLRQRRLRQQLQETRLAAEAGSAGGGLGGSAGGSIGSVPGSALGSEPASSGASMLSAKSSLQLGSASAIGGSKGLAAGLKDNAARVLRSSASTGNLKTAAAAGAGGGGAPGVPLPMPPPLTTVNENSSFFRVGNLTGSDAASIISFKGRRSLDTTRNHHPSSVLHNTSRGATQTSGGIGQFIPMLGSPYVQADQTVSQPATASIYSQYTGSAAALSAPGIAADTATTPFAGFYQRQGSFSSGGAGLTAPNTASAGSAMPVPTPPLISRSRTKSRSRSRNSIVIVNSMGVEETPLAIMVQESRVTQEDNPMRWDWETIRKIILGPVLVSRRLPEEITASGFLTRLARFFHPSSLEFCDLSRTTENEEYLEIGRQLIRILVSSADGLLLIDESRLLMGIVDEIRKQNSYSRKKSRDESCFSFARLQMTMSPGYFHFLSEIDRTLGGDSLLERSRLFDAYYQIVELPDQVLLIQYVLSSMSYATDGHARVVLRKVASSPHEALRMLVPSYLLYLASDVPCRPGSVSAWAIEVLTEMLFDSSPTVRSSVAQCLVLVIDIARENPFLDRNECDVRIKFLLDLQPMFDLAVITDIRPLILRLIGMPAGFAYLQGQGIVDSEMEAWGALEGIFYVQSLELDISRALAFGPLFSSTPDGSMMMTTNPQSPPTPAHLFGELARTTGGRAFLEGFGIPRLLFETLSNIPWNSDLSADIVGLKATLWAIGAMGATREGFLMLEPYDVLGKLLDVARQATSMSIKGTCLYALALLSKSDFAAELFREKGWLLCSSCHGTYEYAVPRRLENILNANDWATGGVLDGTYVFSDDIVNERDVTDDLDSVQREIIESVILISNQVLVNTASKTLLRLRTSHPHYFRILPLYCKVVHLLGKFRYRLSTRRFVYNVFDVNLAALHSDAIVAQAAEASSMNSKLDGLVQGGDTTGEMESAAIGRRFSSSVSAGAQSGLFSQRDSDLQRKRASTLQEYSSSIGPASASLNTTTTMFSRRPTNGLLDDIRPALNRRLGQQQQQQQQQPGFAGNKNLTPMTS